MEVAVKRLIFWHEWNWKNEITKKNMCQFTVFWLTYQSELFSVILWRRFESILGRLISGIFLCIVSNLLNLRLLQAVYIRVDFHFWPLFGRHFLEFQALFMTYFVIKAKTLFCRFGQIYPYARERYILQFQS